MVVLTMIVVICIVAWLSRQKSLLCKRLYIGICGFLAVFGGMMMAVTRETMVEAASGTISQYELPNDDFLVWCVDAFDKFSVVAMSIAFFAILIAVASIGYTKGKTKPLLPYTGKIILGLQIFLILANMVYTFNLVNSYFDVALFISQFTYGAVLLMMLGYIIERMGKKIK